MTRAEISLYILSGLLLSDVCSSCVPDNCLGCNLIADCCQLGYTNNPCVPDSEVLINITGQKAEEGDDIQLSCIHNFTDENLTFTWFKEKEKVEDQEKGELLLKQVHLEDAGKYVCAVNSSCGLCKFSSFNVTVDSSSVIILVICGVSALILVVVMGTVIKCKLTRDNAMYKERMRQRMETEQTGGL